MTRSHFHAGLVFWCFPRGYTPLTALFEMKFRFQGAKKSLGPYDVPERPMLSRQQQMEIRNHWGIWPKLIRSPTTGMWVVSTCTRQCRHALAIGRGLSRPIAISRLLDEVYIPSDRQGLTCHVCSSQGG